MTVRAWWNPVTVALVVMVAVIAIIGMRMTVLIDQVSRDTHNACQVANQTADVWNLVISRSIKDEQQSTDSAVVKQTKIKELLDIRFPHQDCG